MSYLQSVKIFDQGQITKILSNITSGVISKHSTDSRNLTYTVYCLPTGPTGSEVPTSSKFESNSKLLFANDDDESIIDSDSEIDIYVYASSEEGDTEKAKLILQYDV